MTFLTRAGFSQQAAADIFEGRIPDLMGFTDANWNSYIEPILEDRILTDEEKMERERNLERSAELYNEIIMNWNDQKNDKFERKEE